MVHFVGAGPGAPDLITLRGQKLLAQADVIIYAGSLVNPQLLQAAKQDCRIYNSAYMTLEEVLDVMRAAEEEHKTTVRLHTGDPCLYGAIREQMDALDQMGIAYDDCPGVSSFCAAASALNLEYTLPDVSQSVIITRMAGRTPAAIVYKATWEDEKTFVCTVGTLAQTAQENGITKTALMIVGDVVSHSNYRRSDLYHPLFATEFREAKK